MSFDGNILVTAIGSMSAASVIRSLRAAGARYLVGCDIYPADWVAASAMVDSFHRILPGEEGGTYVEQLKRLCVDENIDALVVLTDPEVDVLARNKAEFSAAGIVICIPDEPVVDLSRDKLALYQHFLGDALVRGIPTVELLAASDLACEFPLLTKPRRGRSRQGHMVLRNKQDLEYALRRYGADDYIVQPFCPGAVFVVDLVRDARNSAMVCLGREELLRTTNGAGTTVRMCADPLLERSARQVAERLGVQGCINMEFLREGDGYRLMDVNPRFSAGVGFSILAGYDMPAAHLACFFGGALPPAAPASSRVFIRQQCEVEVAAECPLCYSTPPRWPIADC